MRTVEFKMERQGLVQTGQKVKIIERERTRQEATYMG